MLAGSGFPKVSASLRVSLSVVSVVSVLCIVLSPPSGFSFSPSSFSATFACCLVRRFSYRK